MAKPLQKELKEIARIINGIARAEEENDPDLDRQMKIVEEVFSGFNKKYPKLFIRTQRRISGIYVQIFINEVSVKKVFDDVASKIKGLVGIGLKGFDEANIQEQDKFLSLVNAIANRLFLTYSTDSSTDTVVLEWDAKLGKVELNYDIKSVGNQFHPEFHILEQYALREFDKNIDILKKAYALGFIDVENEAVFEWEDEFYPKMLE